MNKEQLTQKYNQMVSNIRCYDGRGTVDEYACKDCGNKVHTTYGVLGVTPFVIKCNQCGRSMMHDKTYKKDSFPNNIEVKKWVRPSLEDFLRMNNSTQEHILNGGLLLEEEIPSRIESNQHNQ